MTRLLFTWMFFIGVLQGAAQDAFQLAPPLMQYSSVFFTDTAAVTLSFTMQGTSIRYTTDGSEPSLQSRRYKVPITINKNFTTVKAKVFGSGFLPSASTAAVFIKDGLPLKQVQYSAPHANYSGTGADALLDGKGGIPVYNNKNWLGFNSDTVVIDIELAKTSPVKKLLLHLLQDYGSWIFLPQRIEVYATGTTSAAETLVLEKDIIGAREKDAVTCVPLLLQFNKKIYTSHLQVKLFTLQKMPDWHPGKGQKSWIFTDEIKVY